jgi:hypothetical protein
VAHVIFFFVCGVFCLRLLVFVAAVLAAEAFTAVLYAVLTIFFCAVTAVHFFAFLIFFLPKHILINLISTRSTPRMHPVYL